MTFQLHQTSYANGTAAVRGAHTMASTPEGITKKKIAEILQKYEAYYFMPVQNGMGAPGLDFHCILSGLGFCVEAKAWDTDKDMTARQVQTTNKIVKAGGKVFMVRDEITLAQLENWMVMVLLTGGSDRLCIP